jgi:hypothetical protein
MSIENQFWSAWQDVQNPILKIRKERESSLTCALRIAREINNSAVTPLIYFKLCCLPAEELNTSDRNVARMLWDASLPEGKGIVPLLERIAEKQKKGWTKCLKRVWDCCEKDQQKPLLKMFQERAGKQLSAWLVKKEAKPAEVIAIPVERGTRPKNGTQSLEELIEGADLKALYEKCISLKKLSPKQMDQVLSLLVGLSSEQFGECKTFANWIVVRMKVHAKKKGAEWELRQLILECRLASEDSEKLKLAGLALIGAMNARASRNVIDLSFCALIDLLEEAVTRCDEKDVTNVAQAAEALITYQTKDPAKDHRLWSLAVRAWSRGKTNGWLDKAYSFYVSHLCEEKVQKREVIEELLFGLAGSDDPLFYRPRFGEIVERAIAEKLVHAKTNWKRLLNLLVDEEEKFSPMPALCLLAKLKEAELICDEAFERWFSTVAEKALAVKNETRKIVALEAIFFFQQKWLPKTKAEAWYEHYIELMSQKDCSPMTLDALEVLFAAPNGTALTKALFEKVRELKPGSDLLALVAGRLAFLEEKYEEMFDERLQKVVEVQRLADEITWNNKLVPEKRDWDLHPMLLLSYTQRLWTLRLSRRLKEERDDPAEIATQFCQELLSGSGEILFGYPSRLIELQGKLCAALFERKKKAEALQAIESMLEAADGAALYVGRTPELGRMLLEALLAAAKTEGAEAVGELSALILRKTHYEKRFYLDLLNQWEWRRPATEETAEQVRAIAAAFMQRAANLLGMEEAKLLEDIALTFLAWAKNQKLVPQEEKLPKRSPIISLETLCRVYSPEGTKKTSLELLGLLAVSKDTQTQGLFTLALHAALTKKLVDETIVPILLQQLNGIESESQLLCALDHIRGAPREAELVQILLKKFPKKPTWQAVMLGRLAFLRAPGPKDRILTLLQGSPVHHTAASVLFDDQDASMNQIYQVLILSQWAADNLLHKSANPKTSQNMIGCCTTIEDQSPLFPLLRHRLQRGTLLRRLKEDASLVEAKEVLDEHVEGLRHDEQCEFLATLLELWPAKRLDILWQRLVQLPGVDWRPVFFRWLSTGPKWAVRIAFLGMLENWKLKNAFYSIMISRRMLDE